jgi:hypothetical protein
VYEYARLSVRGAIRFCDDLVMDRTSNDDWFVSLLTAGSFLAMVLTGIFALIDALDGSRSCAYEFALSFACGASFVTLLPGFEPL